MHVRTVQLTAGTVRHHGVALSAASARVRERRRRCAFRPNVWNRFRGWVGAAVISACVWVTGGCGNAEGSGSAGPAFEKIDSAGVEIARNGGPSGRGPALLARREVLRIGVREGPPELELFNVRDVVLGPDGALYAAFQTDGEIRVYGPDGGWQRTFGGQGAGPGEFRAITWMGIFGDTVLALDPRLNRMTVFSTAGELLDTWEIRSGMALVTPKARAAGGWLVELDDFGARVPYGIGRPGTDTSRVAIVGSVTDAVASMTQGTPPWQTIDVVVQHPAWTTWGIGQAGGAVFGRNALWDPQQRHTYDASGRIYISRASRYAIDVYDAAGTLVRRVTRQHEPVPITDELKDRYRREVMAHYDTTSTVGEAGLDLVAAAEQHIALPGPDHLPVLGEIAVSEEGAIWVERPDLVEDPLLMEWSRAGYQPEIWDIFDAEGRYTGTVELPRRCTVHVVGPDWVIVTERDELDVQYIVKYQVLP